ncbi:MAG TPA: hypothetical protein VIF64_03700 [Pyrinomonadaceae bacterium]
MTDDAHRNIRRDKLCQVAAGAGFVTRESRRRGIVAALVAGVAGERGVALACMLEA